MTTATYSEAMKEYARNAGAERPERAWILTPWDTWERNPSYQGPAMPHPEAYDHYDEDGTFMGEGSGYRGPDERAVSSDDIPW